MYPRSSDVVCLPGTRKVYFLFCYKSQCMVVRVMKAGVCGKVPPVKRIINEGGEPAPQILCTL